MGNKLIAILVPAIFLFVGVVLLIVAFAINRSLVRKRERCTVSTTAVVSGLEERRGAHTSMDRDVAMITWVPVYSYTAGGREMVTRSAFGQERGHFQVGQRVTLYYDPQDPSHIYVPEEKASHVTWLLGGIGGCFLLIGAAALVLARKLVL